MAVWSVVQYSQVPSDLRLDSEYFKPEYLELDELLSQENTYLWKDLEGDFITGPFGSAFTVDNYVEESSYRYIRGKDVKPFFLQNNDNAYMPEDDFNRLLKFKLDSEDLLVSVVGTLGNVSIVTEEVGEAIFSCKSTAYRSRSVDPYYLCAYLNSKIGQAYLQRKPRGTIQTGLNLDDLETIPIYLPSQELQEDIGNIVRNSRKQLQKSKDLYAEAEALLIRELGLDTINLSVQTTYTANFNEASKAKRMDAEYFQPKYYRVLSAIENCGFEQQRLGELVEPIRNGFDYRDFVDEGTPYIRVGDIKGGRIRLEEAVRVPITSDDVKKNVKLQPKDILFTRKGSFGNSAVVEIGQEHSIISSEIMLLRLKAKLKQEISSEYLSLFLSSDLGYQQIERYVHGVAYYSISQPDLAKLRVAIPPLEVQNKIAKKLKASKAAEDESAELLNTAKARIERLILGG